MTSNFMRRLDYWLGIPLCFIFSIFSWILRKFRWRSETENKPRKIMFIEFSEMGSAILSWPAMKRAKQIYPDSELYYWIFSSNQDAVKVLNIIPPGNIITPRTSNVFVFVLDVLCNLGLIWKEKIDVVIDLELFSRFSSIVTFLTGAPKRAGFHGYTQEGLYRGHLHTHNVVYNPYVHISMNFLSLVYSLHSDNTKTPLVKADLNEGRGDVPLPKIKSSDEGRAHIWDKLKNVAPSINGNSKFVVIHPGINEALPLRRWDFDNYFKLAEKVLAGPDVFVVMVGSLRGQLEESIAKRIKMPRMIDFIGKTTLQELLDLFNVSKILVSHDGGMIHIASLTEIQIIALFGPETPVLYAPLTEKRTILYKKYGCSPCLTAYNHRLSKCTDNKCLQAITVEEVQKVICEKMSLSLRDPREA